MVLDEKLRDSIHGIQPRLIKDLSKIVAQPSVSARKEGIDECAELVKEMIEEIGGSSRILRYEDAAPLVYGEVKSTRSKKTILFYNHYDVQPEEPLELWESPPFEPQVRNGRMYGRGISDDKGEFIARLKLVQSYIESHGEPPCNIKFCVEGEEETGSNHFHEYISQHRTLFKADAALWEHGQVSTKGRPIVSLGGKGTLFVELTMKVLSQDAHSAYAAIVPSAPWRMVELLRTIKRGERILVPGWYDGIQDFSAEELSVLRKQPFDAQFFRRTYGIRDFVDASDDFELKKALQSRPTANIAGLWSGYSGQGMKTVLPAEVRCKMDFRLASGQDPLLLFKKLKSFLAEKGYGDVGVVALDSEPGSRTSFKDRWAQAAINAGEMVYKKKSIIELSSPGTSPMHVIKNAYGAPIVSIGISPPDASLHAPNENIRLDLVQPGMLWIAQMLENYVGHDARAG